MTDIGAQMAAMAALTEKELKKAEAVWPKKAKFYAHVNDEDNMYEAEKLGFEEGTAAFDNYCRTGYEITFDILIEENGAVVATHVNGVKLERPTEI